MTIDITQYPLLAGIYAPEQLRQLAESELSLLSDELRSYLLNSISLSSGHLASGLGVVELTIALHYCYNTPIDRLVWDVGHQAYPHKILTGRAAQLPTIRQRHGLHPFPWREESPYDVLSVGHAGTSISAALGLAIAAQAEASKQHTVCVIGDGALTAGMAFEAMNHAGSLDTNLLVILNDNAMSISKNVGGLRNSLVRMLSGTAYQDLRCCSKSLLAGLPPIKALLKRTEAQLKGMILPSTLFEAFGFNYIGPVDGHDIPTLLNMLRNVQRLSGPQLLHVITQKGKGYAPAEEDPVRYHAVSKFDLTHSQLGAPTTSQPRPPSYPQIFGDWLCEIAATDQRLMAITPAMCEGSGMQRFSKKYPQRYFDVAIAEQHAVTFAAGLAIAGYRPIVAIYSTFLQRAYDQLIHDVALQKLPVLFAVDRGGVVGADGPTHQGAFDLAYARCIPNLLIMTPSDENECRQLLYTGYHADLPALVRYPRGEGIGVPLQSLTKQPIGKGILKRQGKKVALLNFGTLLPAVLQAATHFDATVVDMRFVKPLDEALITTIAAQHEALVTIEAGTIIGGAGVGVLQYLQQQGCQVPLLTIGLPDQFIPQGTVDEIHAELGLDATGIKRQIEHWLAKRSLNNTV
ncbi:MAG: 1-deoxy-D-xylulose-5-phosphate synthase [Candidatus Symbiodolus clandestinus]